MFIKKLIYFDQGEFNRTVSKFKVELKTYLKIEKELLSLLELKEITEDKELSISNPMKYLENMLKEKHKNLPFSFRKLLDLLEIDITPLSKLLGFYKPSILKLENGEIIYTFNESDFKYYTKNQSENTRLKLCSEFIETFFKLSEKGFNNQNLHKIATITSNKIKYDGHLNTLIPNYRYITSTN
jgi:hypothetical protein